MNRTPTLPRILSSLGLALLLATAGSAQDNCGAYAGTISVDEGPVCLQNGQALLSGTPSSDAAVPPGFASTYLLTRTNGLIVEQMGPSPTFAVNSVDVWRIHRLVFDPAALDLAFVQFGATTAYDIQALTTQGGGTACASLSMTGAAVKTADCAPPCTAWAAGMDIDSTTVCLLDGQATLTAAPAGPSNIPAGFQQVFLLSRTNGLVIEQLSPTPSFTVNAVDVWRIHNLVYDPATLDLGTIALGSTTAYDLQALLLQGGGSICASLDISGAPVKTGDCFKPCSASAGTTAAGNPDLCLTEGSAQLNAVPEGSSIIPEGYLLAYLLAEGAGDQTILAASPSPAFTVTAPGTYTVHALVYDPATLDPGGLTGSVIAALNAQLQQGGGGICAALELAGAEFQVVDCAPACLADAGSMTSENQAPCLVGGTAELAAVSNGDTLVPPGMAMAYWLSTGADQVIAALGSSPFFTVADTGLFQVHAFVYDPATFNEGMIAPGETTVFDLNAMLVQGGGTLCAGLDVLGAGFLVHLCAPPCSAGMDTTITVCLSDPEFPLFPLLGANACPGGVWTSPFADVENGMFDPATSAAGTYTYTVSGPNGEVLAATVTVNVLECPAPCEGAGLDAALVVCYTDAPFYLGGTLGGNPCPGGQWEAPDGSAFSGMFNPATDLAGTYSYTVQTDSGAFTATVTVDQVECPEGLTAVPGTVSTAGETAGVESTSGGTLGIWPNPATDRITIAAPGLGTTLRLELVDASGRSFSAEPVRVGARAFTLDVSRLAAGPWTVRVVGSNGVHTGRFLVVAQ